MFSLKNVFSTCSTILDIIKNSIYSVESNSTLECIPLDNIYTIAFYLDRAETVANFCVNKAYKKILEKLIIERRLYELENNMFLKKIYPTYDKMQIIQDECLTYRNENKIDVSVCGTNVGYVRRRNLCKDMILFDPSEGTNYWCGYYKIPFIIKNDEIFDKIIDTIDFNEEITYINKDGNYYIIGWDNGHCNNMSVEGYETLGSTMNQVMQCYALTMKNKEKILCLLEQ
jgi:hypothetical protein